MALTELERDWNWSHPAPSSGSQQYNCNQAAKKGRPDIILCSAGMPQVGLSRATAGHAKTACFAAGFQVTAFQRKQERKQSLFVLPSALGTRMAEVFCEVWQKETFLYSQTVSVLTPPCSSCPTPSQKRPCSASGIGGRMLVKWWCWPGRALHSSLALIHAGCSMPLCLNWQGSTSAVQKGKNITKLPPWAQKNDK